jgi:hypothetical protein
MKKGDRPNGRRPFSIHKNYILGGSISQPRGHSKKDKEKPADSYVKS